MPFAFGQVVLRRYWRDGQNTFAKPMFVVADDEAGLLLWMAVGTEVGQLTENGQTLHDVALDQMRAPRLVRRPWRDFDTLVLMPPGAAYSIWWFFRDGLFSGWYVNLESPATRRGDGVDTTDHVLDVVVQPDRRWAWKDEDEFAARIGHPQYFDPASAAEIRAESERLIELAEAGAHPFDGTHMDFRPDPAWDKLTLPAAQ
ncbi:DUF402 domain-containing protein [Actinoplanes sp. LDG1-06]|uniref:DUF402 domain-containing protein n=1 Tax=Paractinoplanes ovalisporus TaxID=2810368 RepID=A0ABS2AF44_9ACTN|nr:DUF402 domain-containing protein [Actinoplanes ovalisporus]MBM2618429.1 DUF402 domain-containing protein [Actinoplanes ovalisporus]